ncbi:MAG: hypothetical protein V4510_06195 [bacterium]
MNDSTKQEAAIPDDADGRALRLWLRSLRDMHRPEEDIVCLDM